MIVEVDYFAEDILSFPYELECGTTHDRPSSQTEVQQRDAGTSNDPMAAANICLLTSEAF
jgi:hypothetical protein